MEPTRPKGATLVDLLDRILDKGIILNADIIISLAGIPLIGVSLRAALAGMETMLQYGVMEAWDEKTRLWEREHRRRQAELLAQGEEVPARLGSTRLWDGQRHLREELLTRAEEVPVRLGEG